MTQQTAPKTVQAPVFVEEWRGWWELDRQKHALQLRLEFASGGKLFGDGHDSHSQFQLGGSYNSNSAVFRTSLTEKRPGRLFQATIERGNVMKGFWEFEVAGATSKVAAAKAPFWISRASAEGSTPRETSEAASASVAAAAAAASASSASLSGSDRLRNYELLEPLGNGVFGLVSKVRRLSDNKILVWKELNYGRMNTNERRMMMNEVQILSNTSHAHIVKYFDTILVRERQKMYIVIEYCENGDLSRIIERHLQQKRLISEKFIWQVLRQIASSLMACHNRQERILHRDLKPANILLTSNYSVKVCDFGLSTLTTTSSLAYSKVGTPLYMSPEQMHGLGYTDKSDIWSLGCIAYEMAALAPPFDAEDHFELQRMVKAGISKRIPSCFSDDLQRAIVWMLQANPDHRPNASELYNHLLEMSSKASQSQQPVLQAFAAQHQPPSTPEVVAVPRPATAQQQQPSVVYVALWGFELQVASRSDGTRFFKISNVFSGGKAFMCGLTPDMELVSINSMMLSSLPPLQLHDVVQILATANNNGGVGVTLELRSLQGRDSGDQPKIVFLTDDNSDQQLLTARTLSMPPPPSSPAVHVPVQERAHTLGALPYRLPAPAAAITSLDALAAVVPSQVQRQVADVTSNQIPSNGNVTSGNTTVPGDREDTKVDATVVARMAARIEELERDLEALRRENAALKDAAESAKTQISSSRQQIQREVSHDVGPAPNSPSAGFLSKHFVIPPVPNNAPPNAPATPMQQPVQGSQHFPSPPDLLVTSMFQQQLTHHSQAQMLHLQMQQQQMAQRQQQPISRPGPALASTFDALSYTSRDGLKLPALEPPRLLSPHAHAQAGALQIPLPGTRYA
jgi:hypothetical protein